MDARGTETGGRLEMTSALILLAFASLVVFLGALPEMLRSRQLRAATRQHREDTAFVRAVAPSISTPVPRAPMKFKGAR